MNNRLFRSFLNCKYSYTFFYITRIFIKERVLSLIDWNKKIKICIDYNFFSIFVANILK